MTLIEAQQKISIEQYRSLLQRVQVCDVFVRDIRGSLGVRGLPGQIDVTFAEHQPVVSTAGQSASIEVSLDVKASQGTTRVLEFSATLVLLFAFEGEVPQEFFTIFAHYTVPFYSHPYFRELLHTTVVRMGLPPLILPFKEGIIAPAVAENTK